MRNRSALPSASRPFVATLLGLTAGIAAAGAMLYRNDGTLMSPLTVSARDCQMAATGNLDGGQGVIRSAGPASSTIRVDKGERWFCAEAGGLAAGWKPSAN